MKNIRAFIALEMPEQIRQSLSEISAQLKSQLSAIPLHWVPVQNMHLTLKFLGDVRPDQVDKIKLALGSLVEKFPAFQIRLDSLGAFPNPKRARVIWVGVNATSILNDLVHALESDFANLGFEREDRPFAAHLTLARVRGHARVQDLQKIYETLAAAPKSQSISTIADKIVLFQSELRPSGSVYNPLAQFVLLNTQEPS